MAAVLRNLGWGALLSVIAVLGFAPRAGADDILVLPVSGIVRGAEGDVITVGSVAVSPDLVGRTCDVRGQSVNQISVHPGNDLLITTAGQTFVIPDFEDAGFITHEAGVTESVGDTITLQIRLGPDGRSSGGFRVSIDCSSEPEPTTTSTEPATTAPPTSASSTTEPATTEPTTPSTDVAATEPTTTVATTAAPTTAAPTTTVATTAAPTTETPPAGPTATDVQPALPVTGSPTTWILGAGLAMVGAGLAFRRFDRTSPSEG